MHKNEYHTYINLQFNLWTKNEKNTFIEWLTHTKSMQIPEKNQQRQD